jgi:DNA repair ATPase RecN
MICSRQDRMEASIAAMQTDLAETKSFTNQMHEFLVGLESSIATLKDMLEKLRRSMDMFAKTLYRLLSGNSRQDNVSTTNTDFATNCTDLE